MKTLSVAVVLLCVPVGALAETMMTSHYDPRKWKKAANCAAHKTIPFGTKLRVTNPRTEKSTIVVVCGRGPFIYGRQLDIPSGAAKEIGMSGVQRLKVERLGK